MNEIPEERKAGFITAINYFGEQVVKVHAHAKEKQANAKDDQERNVHEGVMVACELFGKIVVNAASEVDPDLLDTQTKPE